MEVRTSEEIYTLAVNSLSRHVNDKELFSYDIPNKGIGVKISKDLSKKIYRQSYYRNCLFDSAICESIGFSGSQFIDTTFLNCNFKNANLHSCNFNNVTFMGDRQESCELIGAGFNKSTFSNCTFENMYIFSCSFTDTVFYDTVFINCTLRLSSLENAQFHKCSFTNVNMSTLNLEYAEFNQIYAKGTIFPFTTIPLSYRLLQQLPLLAEENYIYSAGNSEHKILISQYIDMLSDFEHFYRKKNNFYGLVNIYIFTDKIDEAYNAIQSGILNAVKTRDFRVLQHLCKLVYLNNIFTATQRKILFNNITNWVTQENLSIFEYHSYQLFSDSIRQFLLNTDYEKPTVFFCFQTNINPSELSKQVAFLSVIEAILEDCQVKSSYIELRHNSDYVDYLTIICENHAMLYQVLLMFYGVLTTGTNTLITQFINMITAIGKLKNNKTENTILQSKCDNEILQQLKNTMEIDLIKQELDHKQKMYDMEERKKAIEIEAMNEDLVFKKKMNDVKFQKAFTELENIDLKTIDKKNSEYRSILLENSIDVLVQHTSKNIDIKLFPEMLHYTYQR